MRNEIFTIFYLYNFLPSRTAVFQDSIFVVMPEWEIPAKDGESGKETELAC